MTEHEQKTTLRVLGKRNKQRRENERSAGAECSWEQECRVFAGQACKAAG